MATRTATYKGRTYNLLFLGKTKYGNRARLQFTDGSKDFWVDASLVTETSGQSSSSSRYTKRYRNEDEDCEVCGKNKYTCGHCVGW